MSTLPLRRNRSSIRRKKNNLSLSPTSKDKKYPLSHQPSFHNPTQLDIPLVIAPEDQVSCSVSVTYSYSPVTFSTIVPSYKVSPTHISLNMIVAELNNHIPLNNFQISYKDYQCENYTYCGVFPLKTNEMCLYNKDVDLQEIKIKLRQVFNRDNLLRMEFIEEENENGEEAQPQKEVSEPGHKNKRAKERKIGYIIKKVYMWRKMYCGFVDEKGRHVKLNLEEAAYKIGISKKSLDDYLIQLRMGKLLGFNFNEHKNDKVGVLRTYIKKHKGALKKSKGLE